MFDSAEDCLFVGVLDKAVLDDAAPLRGIQAVPDFLFDAVQLLLIMVAKTQASLRSPRGYQTLLVGEHDTRWIFLHFEQLVAIFLNIVRAANALDDALHRRKTVNLLQHLAV